jgi:transcriptional regulator with XRE-family HTH domain
MSAASLRAALGGGVRAERERIGWSQDRLAEEIRMERKTISRTETGERAATLEEIYAICGALGVTLEDLLQRGQPADLRQLGLRRRSQS